MPTNDQRLRQDPYEIAIADVLRLRKTEVRATQNDLAERTGIAKWQIDRMLNYKAPILGSDFIKLCDALNYPYGEAMSDARARAQRALSS